MRPRATPPRLYLPGIPQHISQRGNNRQACFYAGDGYRLNLQSLGQACRAHDSALHAYVMMTNHVHLLLTPAHAESIPLVICDVGRDYVRSINRSYRRCGTLWKGRYNASLVERDRYCLTCYRYIELNPARAGMVSHPADYPWSSYHCNADGANNRLIAPHDSWLMRGIDEQERCAAYRTLIDERLQQSDLDRIRQCLNKGLPTGDDRFSAEIERALSICIGTRELGRPKKITGN